MSDIPIGELTEAELLEFLKMKPLEVMKTVVPSEQLEIIRQNLARDRKE